MPEEVSYDRDADLIRVRAWGDDPIEDWISSRQQVVELHETLGTSMLLVDVREQGSAPAILDIFDFAEDWPQEIRVAILIGENTNDDIAFLETAAINRGKEMHLFYEESDALKWLRDLSHANEGESI